DELVAPVALLPSEADELPRPRDHGALLWRACNGDTAAAPKLEQPLLAEEAQRTQHGVRVHAEDCCEAAGGRKALAGLRLAVRDRAPDLRRHLLEELGRLLSVDLDVQHRAVHTSTR